MVSIPIEGGWGWMAEGCARRCARGVWPVLGVGVGGRRSRNIDRCLAG